MWQPVITFTVPGDPVGKARPRVARRGKHVKLYTPDKTRAYEEKIGWHARSSHCYLLGPDTPVRVEVIAVFTRPQRLKRAKDPEGLIPHTVKPDLDNVLKSVLDGLNGVVYPDDKQVCSFDANGYYAEKEPTPHKGKHHGHSRTWVRVLIHQPTNTTGSK